MVLSKWWKGGWDNEYFCQNNKSLFISQSCFERPIWVFSYRRMVKGCCALWVMKLPWPCSDQQILKRWMTAAACVWRADAFGLIVWSLSNNYLVFCYKAWWSCREGSLLLIQEVSGCSMLQMGDGGLEQSNLLIPSRHEMNNPIVCKGVMTVA